MPLPLVVGAAAIAGGSALIAWYYSLSDRKREEVDDRCLDAIEKVCGVRDESAVDTSDEGRAVLNELQRKRLIPQDLGDM